MLETAWEELDPPAASTPCSGAPATSTSPSPGGAALGLQVGRQVRGHHPQAALPVPQHAAAGLQRRQLEKYMRILGCAALRRAAAQRRRPGAVTLTSRSPQFAEQPERTLAGRLRRCRSPTPRSFSASWNSTPRARRSPPRRSRRFAAGCSSSRTWAWSISRWTAPPPRSPAARCSASAWPARSAAAWWACSTSSTSRPIGLHPRDNDRLLDTLAQLRDQGNTVVVVEHDEDTMRAADHIVDFGPGPGVRGGHVVAAGPVDEIAASPKASPGSTSPAGGGSRFPPRAARSATSKLRGPRRHAQQSQEHRRRDPAGRLRVRDRRFRLRQELAGERHPGRGPAPRSQRRPGQSRRPSTASRAWSISTRLIAIDQSPIGRTPRSNPATYIKVFDEIRELFTQLPEAKARGYKPGRFSFNVTGGRCEACEGNGSNQLEMDFLADVWVTCPVCEGHRFNRETLQIRFKGKSIAEVLEMDIQEALRPLREHPATSATSCKRCTTWAWTT